MIIAVRELEKASTCKEFLQVKTESSGYFYRWENSAFYCNIHTKMKSGRHDGNAGFVLEGEAV